ncbi:MAG: hypothetical protein SV253_06195 [Halobacteria archaeon]|nr:hypothetical protein [Halobacteria archaeon]
MSPDSGYEADADRFVDEASSTSFSHKTRKETKLWFFRLKKDLSERYDTDIESRSDTDYVVSLTAEDSGTKAEYVVDRRGGDVEVNVHVVSDGERVTHEVWEE